MVKNMSKTLTREEAVWWWVSYAIDDFVIQFSALHKWDAYQPFFLAQGLEKMGKALLIGIEYDKFKDLDLETAKQRIHKIAKGMGHNLAAIIAKVQPHIDLTQELADTYDGFSGEQILDVLQAAYEECRYPVPVSISDSYPVPDCEGVYFDPLMSSGLEKFTNRVALKILLHIESLYGIKKYRKNPYRAKVSDNDWERFSNLFFKDK